MSTKPTPGAARGRRTPAPATPTDGPDMTLAYAAHAQAATEPIKATSIRLPNACTSTCAGTASRPGYPCPS